MKAKLPVTTFQHSENSTQNSGTSDNQPMTSVSSAPGLDAMQEQQTLGSDQSLINSDHNSVTKTQLPVTVFQHYVTSNQQSMTSVKQPVTSVQQSTTSIEQPVTSTQQSLKAVTSMPEQDCQVFNKENKVGQFRNTTQLRILRPID